MSFRYNFVSEPDDDLKCLICLGIARDPLQHEECGKLFCKVCLEKYGKNKPCPNCRAKQSHYYADKRSKRAIQALAVKCNNVERQCTWVGTVETLDRHMATCEFVLLPCPKQCKDQRGWAIHFLKRDIKDHLERKCPNRDYECQCCQEKGTYATITQIHQKTCPKKIVSCPNPDCKLTMQRQEVTDHFQSTCKYTLIPCKYESIGCDVKMKRRDMPDHEQNDKLHFPMLVNTTLQLKIDNGKLKRGLMLAMGEINNLKVTNLALRQDLQSTTHILQLSLAGEPIYKLSDFQKKKEDGGAFTCPAFYTHPRGYHMALKVYANGNSRGAGKYISVFAPLVDGDYNAELKWPFLGDVTITLLNQLEDKNHHSKVVPLTREENARVGSEWGYIQFISHSALGHDPVKNTRYLKDDTLYFRMSVELAN